MSKPTKDTRPVILADFTPEEFASGLVKVVRPKTQPVLKVVRGGK